MSNLHPAVLYFGTAIIPPSGPCFFILSPRPMENFFPMPLQMIIQWQVVTRLRSLHRQAMKRGQPFAEASGAVRFLIDAELQLVAQRKRAAVEEFVVHAAEGEAVGFEIRAAGLMPFDMSCLECHLNRAQSQIVATNRTAILISHENSFSKRRIATAAKCLLELNLQADSIKQMCIERLRKVLLQNLKGQLRDQGRLRTQGLEHIRCKSVCAESPFRRKNLPEKLRKHTTPTYHRLPHGALQHPQAGGSRVSNDDFRKSLTLHSFDSITHREN